MNEQQIKWASTHDWFHSSNGESVLVVETCLSRDGQLSQEIVEIDDINVLRDWAGY